MSYTYNKIKLTPARFDVFSNVVYDNFIHLKDTELNHNIEEIRRILSSDHFIGYEARLNTKVVAYILAELIVTPSGRSAMYIYYLYTAERHRKNGIATILINMVIKYSKKTGCSCIMLTCDGSDINLVSYYKKNGFLVDSVERSSPPYIVMSILSSMG